MGKGKDGGLQETKGSRIQRLATSQPSREGIAQSAQGRGTKEKNNKVRAETTILLNVPDHHRLCARSEPSNYCARAIRVFRTLLRFVPFPEPL